jgi:hypothetical protein
VVGLPRCWMPRATCQGRTRRTRHTCPQPSRWRIFPQLWESGTHPNASYSSVMTHELWPRSCARTLGYHSFGDHWVLGVSVHTILLTHNCTHKLFHKGIDTATIRSAAVLVFPQAPTAGANEVASPVCICRGTNGAEYASAINFRRSKMVDLNMMIGEC